MKEYETKGDTYVHEVIKELNNAFITPIEREDILALTMSMDDVLDGIEHTTALFEMYSITTADDFMLRFVEAIKMCSHEIEDSINLLINKKLHKFVNMPLKLKIMNHSVTAFNDNPLNISFQLKKILFELFNIKKFMKILKILLITVKLLQIR